MPSSAAFTAASFTRSAGDAPVCAWAAAAANTSTSPLAATNRTTPTSVDENVTTNVIPAAHGHSNPNPRIQSPVLARQVNFCRPGRDVRAYPVRHDSSRLVFEEVTCD